MKKNKRTDVIIVTGLVRIWAGIVSPAKLLVNYGIKSIFFYLNTNPEFLKDISEVTIVEARRSAFSNLIQFAQLLFRYRPRHVDVYFHTGAWWTLIGQMLVARSMGIPLVTICTGHEILYYPHRDRVRNLAINVALFLSKAIIIKELYMQDTIKKHRLADPEKLVFISNKVIIGSEPCYSRDTKSVLFLNLLKKYRRIELIIQAAAIVSKKIPDARFLLVGAGRYAQYEDELKKLTRTLGLEEIVSFLPYTESPTQYYETASIFLLPADIVFCNNALLESMERGVPPIVADVPGAELIVEHEKSGLRVNQDASAIADAIIRLLSDESLRLELALGARYKIKTEFDERSRADLLRDLYLTKIWSDQPISNND